MGKKPFRVTNEEATRVVNAGIIIDVKPIYLKMYAADLLDARDLIDKQEAIIKEMREEIGQLALTYAGGGVESVCNNILEQTKDYA